MSLLEHNVTTLMDDVRELRKRIEQLENRRNFNGSNNGTGNGSRPPITLSPEVAAQPATLAQVGRLAKLGITAPPNCTKGMANELIQRALANAEKSEVPVSVAVAEENPFEDE